MSKLQFLNTIDIQIEELIECYLSQKVPNISFDEIALQVHEFQFLYNDFYRNHCIINGISEKLTYFDEIPFIDIEQFKGQLMPSAILSDEIEGIYHETSGTTSGIKGKVYRDKEYFNLRGKTVFAQGVKNWFANFYPKKVQILFLDLANRKNASNFKNEYSVLNNMLLHFGNEKSAFLNIDIDFYKIVAEIKNSYNQNKPIVIVSPSYYLSHFIKRLQKEKISIKLQCNSLIMDSGGLKNKALHNNIDEYKNDLFNTLQLHNTNYKNTYAMTEVGSQFPDIKPNEKEIPIWSKVRIFSKSNINCLDDSIGQIVIFDLLNRNLIFGIKTGDKGCIQNNCLKFVNRLTDGK